MLISKKRKHSSSYTMEQFLYTGVQVLLHEGDLAAPGLRALRHILHISSTNLVASISVNLSAYTPLKGTTTGNPL
jgi:hypothetical protein